MTRAAALGVVLAVASAAAPAGQQPTFRSRADVVAVDVSVRDRTRVVTGLTAADFEVFDNDVLQQVTEVSFGTVPIDVTIAFDVSLSVSGAALVRLRRAVLALMRDLRPADRLRLLTFNMRVSRIVDFTSDTAAVERAIREAAIGGGSSIWDTLAVALVSAADPDRRQLVMLFSDGVDTSSTTDPERLVALAQRTTATVTPVVPTGMILAGRPALPPGMPVFQRLASETGGRLLTVSAASGNLPATFQRALDEFRSSYVVHYTPTGVERAGFHALRVAVKGRGALTVTARRGYVWQ